MNQERRVTPQDAPEEDEFLDESEGEGPSRGRRRIRRRARARRELPGDAPAVGEDEDDLYAEPDDEGDDETPAGGKKKKKKNKNKKKAMRKAARQQVADLVEVQPIARQARMKRRHWGLMLSFVLMVLVPFGATVFYLWTYAQDQYLSTTGFTVRSQESGGATELLGGLAQFAGGSTASDSDILYEYIQSQDVVAAVDAKVDLRAHYGAHWPDDWAFAIWPDAGTEDLVWYWHRIVGISYDSGTGLIEVTAAAYDPETAQAITTAILRESQDQINALNTQAREDAMRYARDDLEEALARLKEAREELTRFRTRTRIVDPESDIQGRMGVLNNLQQQLAAALVEYDLLRGTAPASDPRVTKAQQVIDVIRERIRIERAGFASDSTETGGIEEDYPSLISEYESLSVDREYAEEAYRAALTALEVARDDATRQSRYLATYIRPTLAQESEYPQRPIIAGLAALLLLLVWSIAALIYYSIRDRS